jgi:hypothetical protein
MSKNRPTPDRPQERLDAAIRTALKRLDNQLDTALNQLKGVARLNSEVAERRWATTLEAGASAALRRVRKALGAIRRGIPLGSLAPDLLGIIAVVREEAFPTDVMEDLAAEQAEPGIEGNIAQLLVAIERSGDAACREADRLAAAVVEQLSITPNPSGEIVMPSRDPASSTAPRPASGERNDTIMLDFLSALTTMRGGGSSASAEGPSLGRRYEDVSGQLVATLDAMGLPHVGVSLGAEQRQDDARAQLVDSLRRNFDYRDQDGVRTYHRAERPISTAPASSTRSAALRGLGLVQLATLRFQADMAMQLIDELPAMLPYQPRLDAYNAEMLRGAVRSALDTILTSMAAPLGPTPGQGVGQVRRLLVAVSNWLAGGGIIKGETLRDIVQCDSLSGIGRRLRGLSHQEPLYPESLVRSREIEEQLKQLFDVLATISDTVQDATKSDAGRSGARVEQILTLLYRSAEGLKLELERLGTSEEEQEIAFFSSVHGELSIGQFVRWAMQVAEPFAGGANLSATLRRDELEILGDDLEGLRNEAEQLEQQSSEAGYILRLVGARRQLSEVAYLIRQSEAAARQMIERPQEPTASPEPSPETSIA